MSDKSFLDTNVNILPIFNVPPPKKEPALPFVDTAQPPPSAAKSVFSVAPPSEAEFSVPPPLVNIPPPSITPLTSMPPPSLSVLPTVLAIQSDVARPQINAAYMPPSAAHPRLDVARPPPTILPPKSLPNQPPPPIPDFTRPPPFKRPKYEAETKYEPASNIYPHNNFSDQHVNVNASYSVQSIQSQQYQYSDSQVYAPHVAPYYEKQNQLYTDHVVNPTYHEGAATSMPETVPRIRVRDFSKDRNNSTESLYSRDDEQYRRSSLRRDDPDRSSSRRSERDYTCDRYEGARDISRGSKESLRKLEHSDTIRNHKYQERSRSHHSSHDRREREEEEKRARYHEEREREKRRRRDSEERHRRHPEQREREERRRRDSEERQRRKPESERQRHEDRSRRYTEDRGRMRHTEERLRDPEERRLQEIDVRRLRETEERRFQEPDDRKLRRTEERRSMTGDRHGRASSRAQSSRDHRDYDCRSESSISSRDSHVRRRSERSESRHTTRGTPSEQRVMTDRDKILETYRKNYCRTSEQIMERLENLAKANSEEDEETWYRSSPAELYYKVLDGKGLVEHSPKGVKLAELFFEKLIENPRKARPEVDELCPPVTKTKLHKHKLEAEESSSGESEADNEYECIQNELQRKLKHPRRLHPEMWYNETGEMNDRPLCRCSARAKRLGIRHGVFAGEKQFPRCIPSQNNADKLYHYRITVSPPTNFLIKTPTIISHDEHDFLFSGFSMFSHYKLAELPVCKVIRFNIEYTIVYVEEQAPHNYTIQELDLFEEYLFKEILELMDLDLGKSTEDKCSQFHFMPRFVRNLGEGGCEVLSMCEVLKYLMREYELLVLPEDLSHIHKMDHYSWQKFVDRIKGIIVTCPGKKPCSMRVDQLDRSPPDTPSSRDKVSVDSHYPEIVHFGMRPPQLCYAGIPQYQKAWREYVKFRHLIANMAKPTFEDRQRLQAKESKLQEMRMQSKMKRDITVAVSCEGFYCTGLMCDVVQHAMLIPVLVRHLRFHNSLNSLEESIEYKFRNRSLLQLALTHPSFRDNFGTNPDHARNSLTNCGIRQPEYGDRQIHYMNTRKRGINTLIEIMSRFGKKKETESAIGHNERLEFLGDAVVEFLSTVHLFLMFPGLAEGGLATYRAAIVQNQHLALLAKKIGLEQYMLYTHGSDLCQELELRHAMANCFEALIAALYLDGDIEVANRVFSLSLWLDAPSLMGVWTRERVHPLQEQEPLGDRKYIKKFEFLQKLTKFEDSVGIQFKHIRLLARAFTDRSVGFTHLTLGSNQRLEFLGDTVLQLVVSDRLYRHFPEHHEGHLSLLRSSLVNNRTQSVVCDDLDMTRYAVYHNPKAAPSTKDKADLLEAFLGALFLDKGIEYCTAFCNVCLFPRLQEFIMNQDWNDPKSKLQQCCLTLRTMEGGEPDVPIYKVIECLGPTNTRVYQVAVYFRGSRLASATGHSIQEAEMNAAKLALASSHDLFPQLEHQKRVIAKSVNSHTPGKAKSSKAEREPSSTHDQHKERDKQYIQRLKQKLETSVKDRIPKAYKRGENAYSDESSIASSASDAGSDGGGDAGSDEGGDAGSDGGGDAGSDEGSDKEDSGHISGDSPNDE